MTELNAARTFYKLRELEDKVEKEGYLINFKPQRRVFELRDQKNPDNWCWLIRRTDGTKVELIRDCTIEEWDDVISYNIERLKQAE